jgi:signal transduction histidine kinase
MARLADSLRPLKRALRLAPRTLRASTVWTVIVLTGSFVVTAFLTGALLARLIHATNMSPLAQAVVYLIGASVAAGAALTVGLRAEARLTRPLDDLIAHVHTEGFLAAEGAPYTGEHIIDDVDCPRELSELAAGIEDLLRHLAARQAELNNAVREARLAHETLSVVVSDSTEGLIVLSNGKVAILNPAAALALGKSPHPTAGTTFSEVFEGFSITDERGGSLSSADMLDAALEGPTSVQISRDGQGERWYLVDAHRHVEDLYNRILFSMRDVTEERRLQFVRNEIVSLVSHDLRAPLAVVIGYLDLLKRPMAEEDRARALEAAKRSAGRMADLLEDLLAATRAEELLAPAQLVPVSLAELAEDVVATMSPTHTDRDFRVVTERRPLVLGDEKRLRQAVVNLVTNAFKYSPDGTEVVVRVDTTGSAACVAVEDAGAGVPEEDRDRIFDRFTRIESNARRQPGLGLGLYIVRIIAENHGGGARVEQSSLGGARFVIELPWDGLEEPPDRSAAGPEALESRRAAQPEA